MIWIWTAFIAFVLLMLVLDLGVFHRKAHVVSVKVAIGKARSAALFKRPTKAWQDIVAEGGAGVRILGLEGAVPIEGGLPLLMGDKIVGAIGVSGGTGAQDGVVAKSGADTLK